MLEAPIRSAATWLGSEIRSSSHWIVEIDVAGAHELVLAARDAKAAKTIETLTRADFPLPTLAAAARRWSTTLHEGEGFVLVQGFPAERLGDDAALAYAGLGVHLGTLVPQNRAAKLLCHVCDRGKPRTGPAVRQYMTREAQDFHTGGADVIALLCLRPAKSGGLSRIVSSVSAEEVSGNEPAVSRVCKRIPVPRDKSRGTRVCASPPFGRADRDGRVVAGRVVVR
jgi:hypothetical protein